MKQSAKLLFAIVVAGVTTSFTANAQIGVHVGYVHSKYSHEGALPSFASTDPYNGFDVSVGNKTKIVGNILAIDYGLTYTYLSQELEPVWGYDAKRTAHYLDVPVHLQVGLPIGVARVYIFGGPKLAVGLSSKTVYENAESSLSWNMYCGKVVSNGTIDEEIRAYVGDGGAYKRIDLLQGVGMGIELFGLLDITARYEWGMFNQNKMSEEKLRRNQFNVGLGILF